VGTAADRDWPRHVVDHLDAHASNYEESVRFYATVLEPRGLDPDGNNVEVLYRDVGNPGFQG
jgi:catechol 2,3-dioxygenase-like lactoylglutathione lyase family enzyme